MDVTACYKEEMSFIPGLKLVRNMIILKHVDILI